ncbi:unnamed protein product [Durusdinium trenchii]|uniref:Uncharacterized protein n=1 Tax=Durusdinium trenchii TaxID=1381693 RepID=A0ABP0M9W3_9DINO
MPKAVNPQITGCTDLTEHVVLEVQSPAKCSGTGQVSLKMKGFGDVDLLDTYIQGNLAVIDVDDVSSQRAVEKISLEVTDSNEHNTHRVEMTLFAVGICTHTDFLQLLFPAGSRIKILKNCEAKAVTTTTTTTTAKTVTSSADLCTDLTQGLTLVVESTAFCATGSDHVTMKLRGSDPLEADIEDADLAIVNANRKSVQESVQRIIFESDGDLITAKLYAPEICAEAQFMGLTFPEKSPVRVVQGCSVTTTTTTTTVTCTDLTKGSDLEVNAWSGCTDEAEYAVIELNGTIPLDIVMEDADLALVKASATHVHQSLSKLILEDEEDGTVTGKLYAPDICARLAYLQVVFAPKTLVKFKRACVAEVRQLKIAKSLPLTLSGKSCTNLIAYQLVVESAVSCEAGDDHATMELSGSGYSTAFTQEDLELVNLQSDQVHQKLSSATLEETPNGILAKLFAPGICAELSLRAAKHCPRGQGALAKLVGDKDAASRMLVPLEPTAVWNGGMSGKNLLLVAGGWKFIQLMAAVLVSNRDTSFQAAKENALE